MATRPSSAGTTPFELGVATSPEPTATSVQESVKGHARAIGLVVGFMVFGLLCLVGVVAMIVVRPAILATYHYNQYVVAATHLALLGWIGSVVFGALYQLVPVALETKLYSQRLAAAHLVCQVTGSLGMVWSFWHWNLKHVGHWGSLFALGVGLLFVNVVCTIVRARRWTPFSAGIGSAVLWLMWTVILGLALAAAKCSYESIERLSPDNPLSVVLRGLEAVASVVARFDQMSLMHSHAHLGVLGCYALLLVTVSFRLLPMFTLSRICSVRRVWWAIGLLNAGLLGLIPTMAIRSPWKGLFTVTIVAGLIIYGIELRAILRARRRQVLDGPLRVFLSGVSVLLPLAGLAGVLSWPNLPLTVVTGQLENLYGFLAVFGLLSAALFGMLFKILAFLVWYGAYSRHVGRARVPHLAQMYSDRGVLIGGALYLSALVVIGGGILLSSDAVVRWGGIAMALSAVIHLGNYALILRHSVRPWCLPPDPAVPYTRHTAYGGD